MRRIPRFPWLWVICALVALWLAVICYFIDEEGGGAPADRGASSVSALRTAATAAVRARDPAAFQRLFAPDDAGPRYASQYFTRLFARPVVGLRLAAEPRQGLRYLVLRGTSGERTVCSAWTIQRYGARSVLSAVPPLADVCDATAATGGVHVTRVHVHGVAAYGGRRARPAGA
ncbi:hypothetical protein [Streptomyces sp. NPDC046870]|uniref:hypothetical protein n=1 Tax=Streptomyces sp. NPDC046870 TaxID=3155135 RepID=UPI0034554C60